MLYFNIGTTASCGAFLLVITKSLHASLIETNAGGPVVTIATAEEGGAPSLQGMKAAVNSLCVSEMWKCT